MIEDQVHRADRAAFAGGGSVLEDGEEFREPPLEVLRYYRRAVRLNRLPIVGNALSVVMVVRQPVDIEGSRTGYERLLTRLGMAANGRFPPWQGLVIGLTALVLTPEPIGPGDDAMLREVLGVKLRRMRRRAVRPDPRQPRPGGDRAGDQHQPRRAVHRIRTAGRRPVRALPAVRAADRDVIGSGSPIHGHGKAERIHLSGWKA